MRLQWLAAITFAFVSTTLVQAQPAKPAAQAKPVVQAKAADPTVELRVRSVNDLMAKAEFLGSLIGKEDLAAGVKGLVKGMTNEKTGIEGVDPSRPFGLYANMSMDVINSSVIVMVPIADQKRFLKLLTDRLEIVPEKAEDGALKILVPFVMELYLRFTNDYLYVGRTIEDLDAKKLISPKTFFAKEDDAIASLIFRLDTIPEETKKFVMGQFELHVAEQRRTNAMKEDPIEKAVFNWLADSLPGGLNTFLEDAKELRAKVFIDEKKDELSAEITLSAKSGSTMAKTLKSFAGKSSLPAGITTVKNPAVRIAAKGGLTPELKKTFEKLVDEVSKEAVEKTDPNAKAVVRQALETLAPTLKAAEVDASIALSGPDAKGKYSLIIAGSVKQGKEIEKLLKELSLSAGAVADFDFDVEKIGEFSLHKIKLSNVPNELEKFFGTGTFWLAISDSTIALSIEPDGALIRAGLKAKAVETPILSVEVSTAKLLPIVGQGLKEDELKAILKDAFGDESSEGKDKITVTITSGDQLTVKAKVKGKAVRVFFALDELKKK